MWDGSSIRFSFWQAWASKPVLFIKTKDQVCGMHTPSGQNICVLLTSLGSCFSFSFGSSPYISNCYGKLPPKMVGNILG